MNYTQFNNTDTKNNDTPTGMTDTEALIIIIILVIIVILSLYCCKQKSDVEHNESIERAKIRLQYRYSV